MKTIRDYITIVENNIDERVTIGPDGKVTGGLTPQPAAPAAEPAPYRVDITGYNKVPLPAEPAPAPSNVKSGGATVEFGGQTYDVMVFGDTGIRPRISGSDKAVSAKVYTKGNKMFVLLDAALQPGGD